MRMDDMQLGGHECDKCGCLRHHVIWVKRQAGKVRRRLECDHCGNRMSTTEQRDDGRAGAPRQLGSRRPKPEAPPSGPSGRPLDLRTPPGTRRKRG